jgi:hypothetical protein
MGPPYDVQTLWRKMIPFCLKTAKVENEKNCRLAEYSSLWYLCLQGRISGGFISFLVLYYGWWTLKIWSIHPHPLTSLFWTLGPPSIKSWVRPCLPISILSVGTVRIIYYNKYESIRDVTSIDIEFNRVYRSIPNRDNGPIRNVKNMMIWWCTYQKH